MDDKEHQLEEKDSQLAQKDNTLLEKDKSIAAKDKVVAEKDVIIVQKDEAFALMIAEKDRIIAEKESQLSELQMEFKEVRREFMESTKFALDQLLKKNADYEFTLERFSILRMEGSYGDWYSDPFSVDGYELKLNLETAESGTNMKIRLYPKSGLMRYSMTIGFTLQLLNQLGNHSHYSKKLTIKLDKRSEYSRPYDYIAFQELYRRDKTVQYLKEDSLKLRMWINSSE